MGLFEKQRQLLLQEKRRYELILILQLGLHGLRGRSSGKVVCWLGFNAAASNPALTTGFFQICLKLCLKVNNNNFEIIATCLPPARWIHMQFYCAPDLNQKLHNSTSTISLQFVAGMLLGFVNKAEEKDENTQIFKEREHFLRLFITHQ